MTTASKSSGSAERALIVLRLLGQQARPVPVGLLARQCGMPRSSLHRLLAGLNRMGYVTQEQDGRGWALGPEARRLAKAEPSLADAVRALDAFDREQPELTTEEVASRSALGLEHAERTLFALSEHGLVMRTPQGWTLGARLSGLAARLEPLEELRRAATAPLVTLRDQTGETASLIVRQGERAICLDQVLSRHPLRFAGGVGRSIPLEGTAAGETLTRDSSGPTAATDSTEPGVTAIACRIDGSSRVAAAVSVIAPTARIDPAILRRAKEAIAEAALAISENLAS